MGDYKKLDFEGGVNDDMLAIAFNNSYRIFIGEVSFKDIVDEGDAVVLLAHDPNEDITDENLEEMILYYEYVEYYERCGVLKDLIEERGKKKG